jgi:hypothetical protein
MMERGRLGPETRALLEAIKAAAETIIQAMNDLYGGKKKVRKTHSIGMALPIAPSTRLLTANPHRLYYMIQNNGVANYLAFSPRQTVTAGVFAGDEGTHLAAGQPVTDNSDQGEVWGIANTAPINITVVEVSDIPDSRSK